MARISATHFGRPLSSQPTKSLIFRPFSELKSVLHNGPIRTTGLRAGLVGLLLVCTAAGCTKSPVDRLIDESIVHLKAADAMMLKHSGSIEKLGIAVVNYRMRHRGEFRRLRTEGEKALMALSPEERKTVTERARKGTLALTQRLERNAKAYKDPRMAMRLVRPLMVTATARGLAKGQRPPWMPKIEVRDPHKGHGHGGGALGPRLGGKGAPHKPAPRKAGPATAKPTAPRPE